MPHNCLSKLHTSTEVSESVKKREREIESEREREREKYVSVVFISFWNIFIVQWLLAEEEKSVSECPYGPRLPLHRLWILFVSSELFLSLGIKRPQEGRNKATRYAPWCLKFPNWTKSQAEIMFSFLRKNEDTHVKEGERGHSCATPEATPPRVSDLF